MSANFEKTKWFSYTSSTETTRTWAREITAFEDIPEPFQAAFPNSAGAFPYTIFIPEERASKIHERNSKIIAMFADYFVLWEQIGDEITTLSTDFTDVVSVEHGIILLKSWLKIETLSGTFEIKFNTTNDHFFYPIIDLIRQKMVKPSNLNEKETYEKPDLSKFDFLERINFKFKNYGKRSVRAQDSVLAVVYQPEQNLQDFRLFKKSLFRRYKTDFLIVLTQEELILVKEDKQIRNNFDPAHGGIFTYIPRCQIQKVSFVSQQENSNRIMEVLLPEDAKLICELSEENDGLRELLEMEVWQNLDFSQA